MLKPARGFTLIELMVTMTVAVLLSLAAMPSLAVWIANAKVQSVAEQLQGSMRLAQAEAMRRGRQTVVVLTNGTPAPGGTPATPATNGKNLYIQALPLLTGESLSSASAYVQGTVLSSETKAAITGPAVVCFNTIGRLVTNNAPGLDASNTFKCSASAQTYAISSATGSRTLNVRVAVNGQIRLCDPAKTLSASVPDGC